MRAVFSSKVSFFVFFYGKNDSEPRRCLRYVVVECEDQDSQQREPKTQMYLNVMMRFSQALLKVRKTTAELQAPSLRFSFNADAFPSPRQGDKSVRIMRSLLASQLTFVNRLVQLMKAVQRESGNRKKKVRP